MKFNDAMQANVVIDVADERISIPRFTVGDYVEWGAELDAEQRASQQAAMAELPPKDRFEARIAYRIVPADFAQLARLAYTPAGVKRIIDRCFARAHVIARGGQSLPAPEPLPVERAAAIIAANTGDMPPLARILASIEAAPPPATDNADESAADPLPNGGTSCESGSPATGSATSQPSTPPTPVSTPPA